MYHANRIAIITTLFTALSVCAVECYGIGKSNGHAEVARSAAAVESDKNALKKEIRGNVKHRPGLALLQLEKLVKTWPSEKSHCSKILKKLSNSKDVQAAANLRRALEAAAATPQDGSQAKKWKHDKNAAISAALPFVKSEFPGVAREIAEMILANDGTKCENVNVDNETPITIIGNDEFIEKTKAALSLIEKDAVQFYIVITNYVSIIRRAESSGMRAYDPLPTFKVGIKTAYSSTTWYASAIVHDAHHSKLYNDYVKASGKPVPSNVWTGREAENYCLSAQEEFLKAIHAPQATIKHVQKMRNVDYFSPGVKRNW